MSLSYLQNKSNVDLETLDVGMLAVFTIEPGSDFSNKLEEELNTKRAELSAKNIKVIFVTDKEATSDSQDFVLDSQKEILGQAPQVKNTNGENLILFKIEDGKPQFLVHKENPEHEYDWMVVVSDFADNYVNPNPNSQNLYKWGQVVPESGDYLCIDCGYIGTFETGDIFPVCEVCLSGEPAGPTSSDGAFWEKV